MKFSKIFIFISRDVFLVVPRSLMSFIFPFDYQEESVGIFRQKLLILTNYFIVTTTLLTGLVLSIHHSLPFSIEILSLTDGISKPQLRIPKSQLSLQIIRGASLQVVILLDCNERDREIDCNLFRLKCLRQILVLGQRNLRCWQL